jgi:hypothetical protein
MQYSAAQFLIEVPYMLFMATFYSLIVYSMIGEPSDVVSWSPASCALCPFSMPCLELALPLVTDTTGVAAAGFDWQPDKFFWCVRT